MIRRLQLGTSRLEALKPKALDTFLDGSWIHLGDSDHGEESLRRAPFNRFRSALRRHSVSYVVKHGIQALSFGRMHASAAVHGRADMYNCTNFMSFYYEKGIRLPFNDGSFDFVFSEHFFEHLFLDEALCLMKECHRVLRPFGVLRTCVPDADLRTYEAPEPIGFPDRRVPFSDPAKHKTRWSVYSLSEVVRGAGFEPVPLRYCDREGKYVARNPLDMAASYFGCPDMEMAFDLSCIMRIDSLIVDGIKSSAIEPS